jgi:tetratricopeptide (TPR) repeat protein
MPVDEARMRHVMQVYEQIDDYRGKVRAANLFGMSLYFAGNWDAAVRYYAESEQALRQAGRDHDAAAAAMNRAEVLVQQGRIDEAEPIVSAAVRVLVGAHATTYLGFATTIYGRVALAKGDYPVAMDRLAEARSLCLEMGETDEALTVDALVAECLLRAGSPVDAISYTETALAQVAELGGEVTAEPALHRVHGEALLAGGWAGGAESLRAALECARRRGAPNEVAQTLDALLRHRIGTDEDETRAWRAELAELAVTLGIVSYGTDRVLFPHVESVRLVTG